MSEEKELTETFQLGGLRCLRCKGRDLDRSGREPYRIICQQCGQHYYMVMQIIPVENDSGRLGERLLEASSADKHSGSG